MMILDTDGNSTAKNHNISQLLLDADNDLKHKKMNPYYSKKYHKKSPRVKKSHFLELNWFKTFLSLVSIKLDDRIVYEAIFDTSLISSWLVALYIIWDEVYSYKLEQDLDYFEII